MTLDENFHDIFDVGLECTRLSYNIKQNGKNVQVFVYNPAII